MQPPASMSNRSRMSFRSSPRWVSRWITSTGQALAQMLQATHRRSDGSSSYTRRGSPPHPRPSGQGFEVFQCLLQDAAALPHLGYANEIPVVAVAILPSWDIELESIVDGIRLGPSDVVGNATRSQHGPRDAVRNRFIATQ